MDLDLEQFEELIQKENKQGKRQEKSYNYNKKSRESYERDGSNSVRNDRNNKEDKNYDNPENQFSDKKYTINKKENIDGEKENSVQRVGEKRDNEREKNVMDHRKYDKQREQSRSPRRYNRREDERHSHRRERVDRSIDKRDKKYRKSDSRDRYYKHDRYKRERNNSRSEKRDDDYYKRKKRSRESSQKSRSNGKQEISEEEQKRRQEIEAKKLIEQAQKQKEESLREDCTILVTRLHHKADEKFLWQFFKEFNCGKVRDIRIIRDQKTGKNKGLAYVEFFLPESVLMALACSGKQLMGQTLMIQASQAEKNRVAQASKYQKQLAEQQNYEVKNKNQGFYGQSNKEKNSKICIQGLIDDKKMSNISESDINEYFQGYGTIDSIEIPRDHITFRPKGYIIIEFRRAQEAKDAVDCLNGMEIDGKKIQAQIHTEYLQRQLNAKEYKSGGESINYESGASYIHTAQARAILMQKLMQSRDMKPEQMGLKNAQSLGVISKDDDGQAIRQYNFVNAKSGSGLTQEEFLIKQYGQPSPIVLLCNMFDPHSNEAKEINFFADIKDQVFDISQEIGDVEKIWVDEQSNGFVYIKFSGNSENSIKNAQKLLNLLNGKYFDQRLINAKFVPVNSIL